jgi:hypothetical protein
MDDINSTLSLRNAIVLLEIEHAQKQKVLMDQMRLAYETLRPVNLLKSSFREIGSSPMLLENIISTGLGMASGFLSQKIVVGGSSSIVRKLVGSLLQFVVTNVVSRHPEAVKSIGELISKRFGARKEGKEKDHDTN